MILVKGRINSRDILFKVFRSRTANKPVYIVHLAMDGTYAVERRGVGIAPQSEAARIVAAISTGLLQAEKVLTAIDALRSAGVNIAYAPGMVYASVLGKGETDVTEWIASLDEKHREEATRAHRLLTAAGILDPAASPEEKGAGDE